MFYRKPVYNIDISRWAKWMTVATVSSSIQDKSVKRGLVVTNIFRFAVADMNKNTFNLLLFLFDAKFCERTKAVRKLRAVTCLAGLTMLGLLTFSQEIFEINCLLSNEMDLAIIFYNIMLFILA